MNNTNLKDLTQRLTQNINKVIVGKNETIQRLIIALITSGHVLLERCSQDLDTHKNPE